MSTVRAKFFVTSVEKYYYPDGSAKVCLVPVTASKESPENKIFWDATPTGTISMHINNPEGAKIFEVGHFYYVDFTEAGEPTMQQQIAARAKAGQP